MREQLVHIFEDKVFKLLPKTRSLKILIIGGTIDEPELVYLQKFFEAQVYFVGVEVENIEMSAMLDLNTEYVAEELPFRQMEFDLILCNQVFEHLWDLKNALTIISNYSNESLVWITFPTCDRPHGSPDYYSAGYVPQIVEKLAPLVNLRVLEVGTIGSKREYLFSHLLTHWPSSKQLKHPLISYIGIPGTLLRKISYQFSIIPERIVLQIADNSISEEIRYATGSWILLS